MNNTLVTEASSVWSVAHGRAEINLRGPKLAAA